jgi:hypothetical protein
MRIKPLVFYCNNYRFPDKVSFSPSRSVRKCCHRVECALENVSFDVSSAPCSPPPPSIVFINHRTAMGVVYVCRTVVTPRLRHLFGARARCDRRRRFGCFFLTRAKHHYKRIIVVVAVRRLERAHV